MPDWVVTSFAAIDTPLGVLKTGKEADVSLLDRSVPGGQSGLLAVKTYRSSEHRMFHRDSGYHEGRRVRRSRETRAMATRTAFGRELLAGKWAMAEFEALSRLWSAGASVPYPVQLIGSELMMEFVGEPDGSAAPRLAAATPDGDPVEYWTHLWHDLVDSLTLLADLGSDPRRPVALQRARPPASSASSSTCRRWWTSSAIRRASGSWPVTWPTSASSSPGAAWKTSTLSWSPPPWSTAPASDPPAGPRTTRAAQPLAWRTCVISTWPSSAPDPATPSSPSG